MVRHGNVKNIANEAIDAEYGHEEQTDLYYGNEYDDEEYYDQGSKMKANKKSKNTMAYEEDLDVDDMDEEMRKAIEESKKSAKKKNKKKNEPE